MIYIKNKQAIAKMRIAGQRLSQIVEGMREYVVAGVTTGELDALIETRMRAAELRPMCKGYGTYQHATCISINDVVVHGIPSNRTLVDGDIVTIDVVGSYKGYCVDMARCFAVGTISDTAQRLIDTAQRALDAAIKKIAPKIPLREVCRVIQTVVEKEKFGILRDFVGHGIGKAMHEEPQVPNFVSSDVTALLQQGMTLAIEPMITEHGHEVQVMEDGWTVRTIDGGLSAHIEDTIVVTAHGAEVLTRPNERV